MKVSGFSVQNLHFTRFTGVNRLLSLSPECATTPTVTSALNVAIRPSVLRNIAVALVSPSISSWGVMCPVAPTTSHVGEEEK